MALTSSTAGRDPRPAGTPHATEDVMPKAAHRIAWFVYTGGTDADGRPERIRRTATMRGRWPGYDVTCSCGWETQTGGAVRSHLEQRVWEHKLFAED